MKKMVLQLKRPSLGQAALELRTTPQLLFRTGHIVVHKNQQWAK
jgi:hypothetical protein